MLAALVAVGTVGTGNLLHDSHKLVSDYAGEPHVPGRCAHTSMHRYMNTRVGSRACVGSAARPREEHVRERSSHWQFGTQGQNGHDLALEACRGVTRMLVLHTTPRRWVVSWIRASGPLRVATERVRAFFETGKWLRLVSHRHMNRDRPPHPNRLPSIRAAHGLSHVSPG